MKTLMMLFLIVGVFYCASQIGRLSDSLDAPPITDQTYHAPLAGR